MKNLFGIDIDETKEFPRLLESFYEDTEATSETMYASKDTVEVETKRGKITLRLGIIVGNVVEMSGETFSNGDTHFVELMFLPDIDSMSPERKAWEKKICDVGEDETLDYYDLYTTGHSVQVGCETCMEDGTTRLAQIAASTADTQQSIAGFILDRPVNYAGNTGWQAVEHWLDVE
jgi:hypothetical protein